MRRGRGDRELDRGDLCEDELLGIRNLSSQSCCKSLSAAFGNGP